jgi:hypothetical protein
MRYVEAPQEFRRDGSPVLFLAGGISRVTDDWQARAVQLLGDEPITVLNPRRAEFPLHDPDAHAEQVAWEYRHLRRAHTILFWFPSSPGIDQPIALAELLAHAERGVQLAVGAAEGYPRRRDVVEQLRHARPGLTIYSTLQDTVEAARRVLEPSAGWAVRSVHGTGLGFWRVAVTTDLGSEPAQVVWSKRRAWRAANTIHTGRGEG